MANWAETEYRISGDAETVKKVFTAVDGCITGKIAKSEGSSNSWEGNVILALGGDLSGRYLRAFIQEYSYNEDGSLRIVADEAWGRSGFKECLQELFQELEILYRTEEEGMEIYQTNDVEAVYFTDRYVMLYWKECDYEKEYFVSEDDAYAYIGKLTGGAETPELLEAWNEANVGNAGCELIEFDVIDD